jgi:hypothetical protein
LTLIASQLLFVPLNAFGFSRDSIHLTEPLLQTFSSELDCVRADDQLFITTVLNNNEDRDNEFAAIVEVRDSNGITEYLTWQTGKLKAEQDTQVGVSWTPAKGVQYALRAFAITGFDDLQVLSVIVSSEVEIAPLSGPS